MKAQSSSGFMSVWPAMPAGTMITISCEGCSLGKPTVGNIPGMLIPSTVACQSPASMTATVTDGSSDKLRTRSIDSWRVKVEWKARDVPDGDRKTSGAATDDDVVVRLGGELVRSRHVEGSTSETAIASSCVM